MANHVIQKIEVFKGVDGGWYIRLIAGNNEPLFTSEGHENRVDAAAIAGAVAMQLSGSVPIDIEGENK